MVLAASILANFTFVYVPLTSYKLLFSFQAEFGDSVRFVVVSFGVLQGAKRWQEETKCPYKLYLDPKRALYQYVGLHRSLYKVSIQL